MYGECDNCVECGAETVETCQCLPEETPFEFNGWLITQPTLSECFTFFVNPEVYYGDAYEVWVRKSK